MEDSGLAAVVKFVLRDRQHLGALRVADGLIIPGSSSTSPTRPWPVEEIKGQGQRVSKQELEMASKLIDSYKGPLEAGEVQEHLPRRAARGDRGEGPRRRDLPGSRARGGGDTRPDGGAPPKRASGRRRLPAAAPSAAGIAGQGTLPQAGRALGAPTAHEPAQHADLLDAEEPTHGEVHRGIEA